jgi:hypothetical protein
MVSWSWLHASGKTLLDLQSPSSLSSVVRKTDKSSFSDKVDDPTVEAAETARWRKSSRSSSGACVEVAPRPEAILVRDSKNPQGAVLTFGRDTFAAFIAAVAAGEFELPTDH